MIRAGLLLILSAAFAMPALADFNFQYPRTRFFSDIGRGDTGVAPTDRRRNKTAGERDFRDSDAYDATVPRFGGFGRWNYQYHWRDYRITDSSTVFGAEVYASFLGFEASVFAVADAADELNVGNPITTEYKVGYAFKWLNSVNSVFVAYQDWSKSASRIANTNTVAIEQGFGQNPPTFESSSTEISAHSYWIQEKVQAYNANLYLGMDFWSWLEGPGFRGMLSIGVLANAKEANYFINGARLQGGVIGQSDYHREGSSFPGSNFILEVFRDMREDGIPLMIVGHVEYYLPFGEDPRDALTYGLRIEFAF